MGILNSINSILFQEGLVNFYKRKTNKTFLDNRTLFTINYNNKKTKIYLNKKNGYVDQYIFENGIYEKDIIDDLRLALSPEKTLLDIGSNIGQHSLLLAPYCKKIFAFEPVPHIYEEFCNSVTANGYKNVEVQNYAVGEKEETKSISFFDQNTGASSLIENKNANRQIKVMVNRLENLLPKNQKFDVVKMDVEGYEAIVILGNKEIFAENKPTIFLEFCPKSINEAGTYNDKELLNFFFENGFKVFSRKLNKSFTTFSDELLTTDNIIISPLES